VAVNVRVTFVGFPYVPVLGAVQLVRPEAHAGVALAPSSTICASDAYTSR
jgi:hypothetical protein